MKKPHKHKPGKPAAQRARSAPREAAAFVGHSTRRTPPHARHDSRGGHAARRSDTASLYRRTGPLHVQSRDDRQTLRLLLLPFAIMALALAVLPALHVYPTLQDLIARTPLQSAAPVTTLATLTPTEAPRPLQDGITTVQTVAQRESPAQPLAQAAWVVPSPVTQSPTLANDRIAPDAVALVAGKRAAAHAPALPDLRLTQAEESPLRLAGAPELVRAAAPQLTVLQPRRSPDEPSRLTQMAILEARAAPATPEPALASREPVLLMPLPPTPYEMSCPVTYASAAPSDEESNGTANLSEPFGVRLATAAASQTRHFVIYDDKYRQIARTGGDVPALYGVCTDVVIRAYRSLGVDLQTLVQASRLGAGDPNIDHRRTETLRRFLARYGQSLPVTSFGENYQPGDIVTYWRPQNSGSRSHIAIVAGTLGPSGNPMIIHNRGWGPQVEDGLFVDRITGHYRYDGASRPPLPPQLAASKAAPFAVTSPATPAAALSRPTELDTSAQNGL